MSFSEIEEPLRNALAGAQVGCWRSDLRTRLTTRDATFNALLGLPAVESTQKIEELYELVHPDDRAQVRETLEDATRACSDFDFECRIVQPSGAIRWIRDAGRVSAGPDGKPFLMAGAVIDVTRARETDEVNRTLRAQAEEANLAKDEFLAMLGHELRNPLAPIVTALELLKIRGAGFERERTMIARQVQHMLRLVEDLLDVSRITRGKVHLEKKEVDVSVVIAKAIEMASPLLQEKAHSVKVDIPPGARKVRVDAGRFAQVLCNLLTNAAKYTDPSGHIEIAVEQSATEMIFRVRDDGSGIPPELMPKLFNIFVQGERRADRSQGGLGIGLSVVRNLVALHGGSVSAESAGAGKGSCFVVRIPLLGAIPEDPADERTPAEALPPGQAARRCILVVDDNRDAADLIGESLRTLGHQVRVAYSGERALVLLRELQPEIVILDIGLPGEDGYALAPRLREASATPLTLIALTGYGQERDRARAATAGFDAHLVKPVTTAKLLAAFPRKI